MKRQVSILLILFYHFISAGNIYSQQKISDLNSKLIELTIKDQLSPPVASRVLAYSNLSFYLAYHINDSSEKIFRNILFNRNQSYRVSKNEIDVDTFNVANYVFLKTAMALTYDTMFVYREIENFKTKLKTGDFEYAGTILKTVYRLMNKDGFKERTSLKKYEENNQPMSYQLTPPAYRLPIEPHWGTIQPFFISNTDSFLVKNEYDIQSNKKFQKENKLLYKNSLKCGEKEKQIAYFWDCNPVHVTNIGHTKKITYRMSPAAHWISIIIQIVDSLPLSQKDQSNIFCLSSIAMADAFIVCWKNKYQANSIRPVTFINNHIDTKWNSYIETPSFPEYPSGHSAISSACSFVLTNIFSDKYIFVDESQVPFGGIIKKFSSFDDAAEEAGMSRYYGGIHYKNAIEDGYNQGKMIGNHIWEQTH